MSRSEIKPLVTIIIPVFNDEDYIERALDTATGQSFKNIEIICVDDCSTDSTAAIIQKYAIKDTRVHLIQHETNASAFQARHTGVKAASADYILFLDGDDELHKDAVKLSHTQALESNSDIVGFGSKIVRQDGSSPRDFERSIQPIYENLAGPNIVAKLFEADKPSQGSMWRYLFSKSLLLNVYSLFPNNQRLYRTNDLPISFLAASLAKKYTSIKNRLYTYHYYAGGSGSANFTIDKFKFYTQAIDSLNVLKEIIETHNFSEESKASYHSARLFVISNILRQIQNNLPVKFHKEAVDVLLTKITLSEVTLAMASFIPEALDTIRDHLAIKKSHKKSKNVAVFTNNLNTGGVQAVAVSQAKYLRDAGFNVTIILLKDDNIAYEIPDGVTLKVVKKGPLQARLAYFESILSHNKIDTVIDHNIIYNFTWPFFNLIAKSLNIKTLAWIHSFSLRPMTEGNTIGTFLNENIRLIDDLVVLSKADVSYWKSLGHNSVYCLPNPPSPLLIEKREEIKPKSTPTTHLNIIWFGRLQQATKKVYSLVDIAAELQKLTDDFTFTIIGPDSNDLKIQQVQERVVSKKLEKHVKVVGPKHGEDLVREFKQAHLYVNTSIIEGYSLTTIEAQSYALPVVMYELPWLSIVENNNGIIQTPQKKPAIAAQQIYNLFINKSLYEKASKASIAASNTYISHDFAKLYSQLLQHTLPKEFSPNINVEHMGIFTKWTQIYFTELMTHGESVNTPDALKRRDTEIAALKSSKAMKIGNAIASPIRAAKVVKHKASRRLKRLR